MLVPLNGESESSCSVGDRAQQWPTPDANVFQDGHSVSAEEWTARRERLKASAGNGNGCGTPLAMAAQLWSTPRVASALCRESLRPQESIRKHADNRNRQTTGNLEDDVSMWSTPTVQDSANDGTPSQAARNSPPLNVQASQWATPAATDGEKAPKFHKGGNPSLPEQAKHFPCGPQVRDWVAMALSMTFENFSDATLKALGESISPSCETPSDGSESSKATPTSRRRLNPKFVEWLQGWPEGWTDCAPLATALFRAWQQRHSELCGIACTEGK